MRAFLSTKAALAAEGGIGGRDCPAYRPHRARRVAHVTADSTFRQAQDSNHHRSSAHSDPISFLAATRACPPRIPPPINERLHFLERRSCRGRRGERPERWNEVP